MTTEDDFQRMIDERPDDWQSRLVLADWLQERGDPRAAGYRAVAVQQRRPLEGEKKHDDGKTHRTWWWYCPHADSPAYSMHNHVPRDWFDLLPAGEGSESFWPVHTATGGLKSRRDCEDALALAFAKLPPARQAELLKPSS